MNATEYKKYHESLMQNNHGSTAVHTFFCILFTVQWSVHCALVKQKNETFRYIYEYLVIVFPLTLAHTVLSDFIYELNFISSCVILYNLRTSTTRLNVYNRLCLANFFPRNLVKSISIIRGLTYLITVYCILAVDFQSFPRNLAKTEKFGFSLMDTGVGLFVLMSGLVHKNLSTTSTKHIIKSNTKFVTVLVVLGVSRFVFIKQLDYQEHVTEYGVHWNFFFTLAICKVLSTIILALIDRPLILSLIVIVLHQYILSRGLQDWVFSDIPRTDWLSANREGLSSTLGYVSLYLFGVHLKNLLTEAHAYRFQIFFRHVVGCIALWVLSYGYQRHFPISRVLANFTYCTYLAAIMITLLTILYFFEVTFQFNKKIKFEVPLILKATNQNGLLYFLFANLLTGAVNLTIRTLFVPPILTVIILNCYMLVTLALTVFLQNKGIKT